MLKKISFMLLIVLSVMFTADSYAQLTINGAQFFIESGATVTVQGDITSNTDILGAGKVLLKGTGNQNINMNNFTIPNLEMDNGSNATLTGNVKIGTDLLFTNGKIILGSNNLIMSAAATITSPGSSKFVVTNGTGKLIKASVGNTAFTYPVGNTALTYNPVSISNSGTVDSIAVRCLANANNTGLTGTGFTKEVVDASWDISEALAGGSNLSLTASWDGTDELPGFNRNKAGISYYITSPAPNVGWDLLNSQTAAATGAGPYSYTRTGITELGAFAIGTRPVLSPLLVSPKIFLQSNFSTGTGFMSDNLRLKNLIPVNEPYDSIPNFIHSGSGGKESSTAAIVGSAAPAGNDAIVDWVFVQLHDAVSGLVVSTRSVLLQRDGDIVETDGVSDVNMAGNVSGNYYISVRHRNHLGARTASTLALVKTTALPYDFTTAQTKAFNDGIIVNPPMADIGSTPGTIFGLYGGNINVDRTTRKTGSATVNDFSLLLSGVNSSSAPGPTDVYRREDLNMDGNIRKTGSSTTNDFSRLLAILNGSNILTQPLF